MKKNTLYIVIGILIVIIAAGATYIFLISKEHSNVSNNNVQDSEDKEDINNSDNETEQPETVSDKVELTSIKRVNDTVVEEYEITLNGKSKIAQVVFKLEDCPDCGFTTFEGYFEGLYVASPEYDIELNEDNVKKLFNQNNFQIIGGKDNKNYLLVYSNIEGGTFTDYVYVYNDNLDLISKDSIPEDLNDDMISGFVLKSGNDAVGSVKEKDDFSYGIDNSTNITKNYMFKAENDKLYYLVPALEKINFDVENNYYGKLEERVYYIENDKLYYDIINTYTISSVINLT